MAAKTAAKRAAKREAQRGAKRGAKTAPAVLAPPTTQAEQPAPVLQKPLVLQLQVVEARPHDQSVSSILASPHSTVFGKEVWQRVIVLVHARRI
jgi:hypothetical protein